MNDEISKNANHISTEEQELIYTLESTLHYWEGSVDGFLDSMNQVYSPLFGLDDDTSNLDTASQHSIEQDAKLR